MKDAAVPALRDVLHHSKKKSSQRMNAIGATLSRKLIKKKSKRCMMCFEGGYHNFEQENYVPDGHATTLVPPLQ